MFGDFIPWFVISCSATVQISIRPRVCGTPFLPAGSEMMLFDNWGRISFWREAEVVDIGDFLALEEYMLKLLGIGDKGIFVI